MKKRLIWVALATLTLSVSACGGKSGNEPTPPTPNPGNGIEKIVPDADGQKALASQVYFRMPAGTNFKLRVKGAGELSLLGASKTNSANEYTVDQAGIVGFEGTFEALDVTANGITEFKINKPSPSLKRLILLTQDGGSQNVSSIDLKNAPELTYLWLGGHVLEHLDLTAQTKLTELGLGSFNRVPKFRGIQRSSDYKKVSLPANNVIELFVSRSPFTNEGLDIDNLPKLKEFWAQSPNFSKVAFAKSQDLEQLFIVRPSGYLGFDLDLENKPKLKDISLQETSIPTAKLHNLPALSVESNIIAINTKSVDLSGIPAAVVAHLLKSFSPSTVETLVLSGSDVTTLDLSSFVKLTTLNLKGTGLSEAELVKTIGQLPTTSGKLQIEAARLSTAVQSALTAKGWSAETN